MAAQNELTFDLRHSIQLTVGNTSGRLTIKAVADFLAEAIRHFKHHRDVLKTDLYTEAPYRRTVQGGRRSRGTMQLSCPADQGEQCRTVALWTDAVIDAYTNANSIEDMLEELPAYRKASEQEGGWLREVVGLLEKPGGDLQAMEAMMKRTLVEDQKAGRYKPGVIPG